MDSTLGGSPGGRRQGWCKTIKLKIKTFPCGSWFESAISTKINMLNLNQNYISSKVNTSGGLKVTSLQ